MELTREVLQELAKPFPPEKIGLKVQSVMDKSAERESNALIVPFIDARDVAQRLDDVVGGEWYDNYSKAPSGGLECALTVCGVTRRDVGSDDNDTEAQKSGYSDSFKRAAVKFGIGRANYDLPKMWGIAEKKGKNWYLKRDEESRLRRGMAGDKAAFNAPQPQGNNSQSTSQTTTHPSVTQSAAPATTSETTKSTTPNNGAAIKAPLIKTKKWNEVVAKSMELGILKDIKVQTPLFKLLAALNISEINDQNIETVKGQITESAKKLKEA